MFYILFDVLTKLSDLIHYVRCINNIKSLNQPYYWFFLIFQKIITFFNLLGQLWLKITLKSFKSRIQKNFVEQNNCKVQSQYPSMKVSYKPANQRLTKRVIK